MKDNQVYGQTSPSAENCFSRSLFVTRADNPDINIVSRILNTMGTTKIKIQLNIHQQRVQQSKRKNHLCCRKWMD